MEAAACSAVLQVTTLNHPVALPASSVLPCCFVAPWPAQVVNADVPERDFWQVVLGSAAISQQLSTVVAAVSVPVHLRLGLLQGQTLLLVNVLLLLVGELYIRIADEPACNCTVQLQSCAAGVVTCSGQLVEEFRAFPWAPNLDCKVHNEVVIHPCSVPTGTQLLAL